MEEKKTPKKAAKTPKAARNVSREPLREHVRGERGAGRKPVASIMVPQEVKALFDCYKEVYAARFGTATNEQILSRWMDAIGTEFDKTVAQEARKLYRKRLQQAKAAAKGAEKATQAASEEAAPEGE